MYIDKNLLFVDTLTTTTSGAATDYIDSTTTGIKLNDANKQPWWWVKTEALWVTSNAASATFALQTCAESTFSSPTTLASSAALLVASLLANKFVVRQKVPLGVLRYLRVYMTVGGSGVFTTASYSSGLAIDVDMDLP